MIRGPPPKNFHPCPYGDQLWNDELYCSRGALLNDKNCTYELCQKIWKTHVRSRLGDYPLKIDQYCQNCGFNWFKDTTLDKIELGETVNIVCPECESDKTNWNVYALIGDSWIGYNKRMRKDRKIT